MTASCSTTRPVPTHVLFVVSNPADSTTVGGPGRLLTGQQPYGGGETADLLIEAPGG